MSETGVFAVLLLIVLAQVLGSVGLIVWARRVAAKRGTPLYRRLRWLPIVGAVLLVSGVTVAAALIVRGGFDLASHAVPEDRARMLAEAISQGMNVGASIGMIAWALLISSAVASLVGSRRA